jgi:hypothetical protein
MYGPSFEIYRQPDPNKKDAEWANGCITVLRRDMRPLVNQVRCRENKKLLDSMQSIDYIKDNFKDKEFKEHMEWDPLGVMEVFKNILIEDIMKDPPKAELKAIDPLAISDREKDILKLRNRKIIENDINKYQSQVMSGMPKYKYGPEKFKSNVADFEKLGLNENDPEDLTFFEQEIQRLNYEIAGQSVLNLVFKLCRFDLDTVLKVVRDILSIKALALQIYVDKITGEIKCKYLYPETFYGIFGDSGDGRNDIAKGWVDNISINEWLQLVGNEFDWDRDWRKLLWAINYCSQIKYTGFIRSNTIYDCCKNEAWLKEGGLPLTSESNLIDWTLAFSYQIQCGYVEWKVEEATSTVLKNKKGFVDIVPYNLELKEKEIVEGYYKESNYQQQTYGSYFIATGTVSQWIFGYSKVYYQNLSGANDEYSDGTLMYQIYPGKSAAEIAKPYIRMCNEAFFKMLWTIDKAKPEDDVYIYEEIVQIAKIMQQAYPQNQSNKTPSLQTIIKEVIEYQRANFVRLRAFPRIDGKPIAQLPTLEGRKNGLDPVYISMLSVMTWAEMQIGAKIGVNPMRVGMNPPERESEKSETNTIQYSMQTTSYIYRMIQTVKNRAATTILNYTQSIISFEDSIPYKWLSKAVGEEDFKSIKLLGPYAVHRYGMFVNDYNTNKLRQRIEQAAEMALSQKEITLDQWGLVIETEDPKKAMKLLAVYKRKEKKRERRQQLEDAKIKQQFQAAEQAHEKAMTALKGQIEIKKAEIEKEALIGSAQVQSDGRIEVKKITVDSEGQKQADKAQASKEVNTSKEKDKESTPFPAVAGGQ